MPKQEPVGGLAALVRDLAAQHHEGVLYRMAQHVGLSMSLLDQWSKGLVKEPSMGSLRKLATAYGLEFSSVLEAAYPELRKKPSSPLSRRLAGLLFALGLGWGWAVDPQPLDATRVSWMSAPLPLAAQGEGRSIMSTWGGWSWWGVVADYYLARAWRCGLTSFRAWPAGPIYLHGA